MKKWKKMTNNPFFVLSTEGEIASSWTSRRILGGQPMCKGYEAIQTPLDSRFANNSWRGTLNNKFPISNHLTNENRRGIDLTSLSCQKQLRFKNRLKGKVLQMRFIFILWRSRMSVMNFNTPSPRSVNVSHSLAYKFKSDLRVIFWQFWS